MYEFRLLFFFETTPKFTTFENIDKKKCIVEIETMVTKYMWDMRSRNKEEEEDSEYVTETNGENGGDARDDESALNTAPNPPAPPSS